MEKPQLILVVKELLGDRADDFLNNPYPLLEDRTPSYVMENEPWGVDKIYRLAAVTHLIQRGY